MSVWTSRMMKLKTAINWMENKLHVMWLTCLFLFLFLSPISSCAAYFTIFLNVVILNCNKFECQDMYNHAILPILFQTVISPILKKKVLITKNSPQPIRYLKVTKSNIKENKALLLECIKKTHPSKILLKKSSI